MAQNIVEKLVRIVLVWGFLIMVALTFFDVLGRKFFNAPIYGAHDITEHLMAIVVFAGLPLVTFSKEHLTVDLFEKFVLRPSMWWWRFIIGVIIAVNLGAIATMLFFASQDALSISEVSMELFVPRAPLYLFMAVMAGIATLASLFTYVKTTQNTKNKKV